MTGYHVGYSICRIRPQGCKTSVPAGMLTMGKRSGVSACWTKPPLPHPTGSLGGVLLRGLAGLGDFFLRQRIPLLPTTHQPANL